MWLHKIPQRLLLDFKHKSSPHYTLFLICCGMKNTTQESCGS